MSSNRLVLLAVLVALIAAFFLFDLGRFFSLGYLKSQQIAIDAWYEAHPWQTVLIYLGVYVASRGAVLAGRNGDDPCGGGHLRSAVGHAHRLVCLEHRRHAGLPRGRFLFRDAIQRRFGDKLRAINTGVEREGAFYLFTLRLVPAFPFFVINLLMGLTPMKARTFYWVSQVGMLLGTIVYVNAGTQLAQIDSLQGHPVARTARLVRAARHLPAGRRRRSWIAGPSAARSTRKWPQACTLRPQPRGDRGRLGGAGGRLHRRGGEGQGDAGREAQDGRGLPQHRLRAVQGA